MRTCKFKAWRLNERSALVAREWRRNLMHEMDGMLEAWLGARGTHSLTHGGEPAGGWEMRRQSQMIIYFMCKRLSDSRHRASKKCRTHHRHV